MKTIDLYHYEEDGNTVVYTRERLKEVGLDTDEKVKKAEEITGIEGHWDTVTLKDPVAAMERDIKRACRIPDADRGFIIDDTDLPAIRAEIAVENWTFQQDLSREGYHKLNFKIAQVLDFLIVSHLYGGAMDDRFLSALNSRPKTSEGGKASR